MTTIEWISHGRLLNATQINYENERTQSNVNPMLYLNPKWLEIPWYKPKNLWPRFLIMEAADEKIPLDLN